MEWFTGSKKGLEKIARRRGLSYVLFELVQNAWDTGATDVTVSFEPVEGRPLCWVRVEDDDPDGFKDLTHAWTLFAESEKKGDPEKRGRFNLGEKLVLAICERAEIISTKGNVRFDSDGRHVGRRRRDKGTLFEGLVKMTRDELTEVRSAASSLIPPSGVITTIGGETLRLRAPLKEFECTLPTEVANEEGFLVSRQRKTTVRVYETALLQGPEETAHGWLYEMGIPVCPTGDPWDVEIGQKVPVNLERNSVSEAYLRSVRVFVLNHMHDQLQPEQAATPAVLDALTDKRIEAAAVQTVLTHQYGEKRAVYDPSDPEANNRLVSEGYTVIPPRAFSKDAWTSIRMHSAALPSGQIRPTPKPYSPGGPPAVFIPEEEWTPALRALADYAIGYGQRLLGCQVRVRFERKRFTSDWAANYGARTLTFNYEKLGKRWFEDGPRVEVNDLLIHEFAHETADNHLSTDFYKALQRLGARSTHIALTDPEFFRQHNYK